MPIYLKGKSPSCSRCLTSADAWASRNERQLGLVSALVSFVFFIWASEAYAASLDDPRGSCGNARATAGWTMWAFLLAFGASLPFCCGWLANAPRARHIFLHLAFWVYAVSMGVIINSWANRITVECEKHLDENVHSLWIYYNTVSVLFALAAPFVLFYWARSTYRYRGRCLCCCCDGGDKSPGSTTTTTTTTTHDFGHTPMDDDSETEEFEASSTSRQTQPPIPLNVTSLV